MENATILFILLRMRLWTRCRSNPMTLIEHSQGRQQHQNTTQANDLRHNLELLLVRMRSEGGVAAHWGLLG
jgi:hypothetical protein